MPTSPRKRIVYVGNHSVPWSTETHLGESLQALGHHLIRIQERDSVWAGIPDHAVQTDADMVLFTRTLSLDSDLSTQVDGFTKLHKLGIPLVGVHLDLFAGIEREHLLDDEPWFKGCDIIFTADGGHPEAWESRGITHHWMPPGVYAPDCYYGTPREEYRRQVGFVGSWRPGYHPESVHRPAMISHLQDTIPPDRLGLWPTAEAIRGRALNDLYASTPIFVGDSCMAGVGARMYVSDRVPETLGRGGFLIHPHIDGVTDGSLYMPGEHLVTFPPFDFKELSRLIDYYWAHDAAREKIRRAGHEHVRRFHTYKVRMQQMLDALAERGIL